MLLKRIAKSNLKQRLKSYIQLSERQKKGHNVAADIAYPPKTPEELKDELREYASYCLKNTANPDELFMSWVDEIHSSDLGLDSAKRLLEKAD